jgi:predicted HD phosphohydrolase
VRPFEDVDTLFEALAEGIRHDDEENVDILAHGLQCAAILSAEAPGDAELQVAGLVHDVGWYAGAGGSDHAPRGAELVRPLLGDRIAWLVARHADAKRFLVTTDPSYLGLLSARSTVTLDAQGGVLDHDELLELRAAPELPALLALRRADDRAKVPGLDVPGLDPWRAVVERVARPERIG